jgi:hypothetical protein
MPFSLIFQKEVFYKESSFYEGNYFRRAAKYGGRRSKSSVPKVNPWCFIVVEYTQKLPPSRMASCSHAHVHIPVMGVALKDVCLPGTFHTAFDAEGAGGQDPVHCGDEVQEFCEWVQFLQPAIRLEHTGCPRRNVPDFGRVFLMLKYVGGSKSSQTGPVD